MQLAVDLVNTRDARDDVEHLVTLDDLVRFVTEHGEGFKLNDWQLTESDLHEVRALRARLRDVFLSASKEEAAEGLNAILADSAATPRVSVHGERPHLHFEPADAGPARWLGTVAAMGITVALVEGGWKRLGKCASDRCDDVFVDMSRNRSRRHCSDTCTTRENVAAYRRRQRA